MKLNDIPKYTDLFIPNLYYDEKYYPEDKEFEPGIDLKELDTYEKWMGDNQEWVSNTGTTIYKTKVCYLPEINDDGIICFKNNYSTYWQPTLVTSDEQGNFFVFNKQLEKWILIKKEYKDPYTEYIVSVFYYSLLK